MMEKSRRGGSAAPNTSEERRQEPGLKTPGHATARKSEAIWSGKATGEAGGEEGRPHETQGRQARSRLEELTFGTFNVCTAIVNGVNDIGHINILLRPYAAKGCDIIGLQETKTDGTSEIVASGYRVFFSSDCSGIKVRTV